MLSVAYALPGLRLGWLSGPKDLMDTIWGLRDYTTIAAGIFILPIGTLIGSFIICVFAVIVLRALSGLRAEREHWIQLAAAGLSTPMRCNCSVSHSAVIPAGMGGKVWSLIVDRSSLLAHG